MAQTQNSGMLGFNPMNDAFRDVREALGVIVESYNQVEQYFCDAIGFATGVDPDTSPEIIKARCYSDKLKAPTCLR